MKIKYYKYALRHKRIYFASLLALTISIICSLVGPFLMGYIVDEVIINGNHSKVWTLGTLMFLSYSFAGVFHYVEEYNSDKISKAVASDTRRDLFAWIQKQDGNFFKQRSAADLMSRTTTDANNIGFAFGFCGIYMLEVVLTIIAMSIAIFSVNPLGSIVPLLCLPVIIALAYTAEAKGDKILDEISDQSANINQVAGEAVNGIRTVKAFGGEEKEKRRFDKFNTRFWHLNNKIDFLWADWYSPVDTISRAMILVNILLCGVLVINDSLSIGDFTTIFQYTNQLSLPIINIGWLLRTFAQARAAGRKINVIMDHEPEVVGGDDEIEKNASTLEFNNVSLSVNGRDLLKDISFKLERGKSLAIMGASGSGKSLIASLAVRLIDPTEGEVLIDGVDVRSCSLQSVRAFSSIVTQDVFLFSDSVIDNIRLGSRDEIDRDVCIDAAKRAKASGFVENLSNGYDTVIGERGVGLSGGQKQRLSIARAFAKKSHLIILDDATSALDMETERDIERTLRGEKDISMMIIAHRLSAIAFADEIIVLDKGRIIERGNHEQLMALGGLYYKTYISQYPERA